MLKEAAQIIRTHGWTQGRYITENNEVCAIGAIAATLGGVENARRYAWEARHLNEIQLLEEAIEKLFPGRYPTRTWSYIKVMDFNDDPGTTKEQVLAVFDKAMELEVSQSNNPLDTK